MRHAFLAALLFVAGAGPTLASPCSDQIDKLSKRVQGEGREAISASTGGQADAAARGGQGIAGSTGADASGTTPPDKSADAGKGAEKAQAAKVALDEARTADGKGDATACNTAIDRVRENLANAP